MDSPVPICSSSSSPPPLAALPTKQANRSVETFESRRAGISLSQCVSQLLVLAASCSTCTEGGMHRPMLPVWTATRDVQRRTLPARAPDKAIGFVRYI